MPRAQLVKEGGLRVILKPSPYGNSQKWRQTKNYYSNNVTIIKNNLKNNYLYLFKDKQTQIKTNYLSGEAAKINYNQTIKTKEKLSNKQNNILEIFLLKNKYNYITKETKEYAYYYMQILHFQNGKYWELHTKLGIK